MSVLTLQILGEKGDQIRSDERLGATRFGGPEELRGISKLIVSGIPEFDEPGVLVQLVKQLACAACNTVRPGQEQERLFES